MKQIVRYFIFISLIFFTFVIFFGCSVKSQNVTNVVQIENIKPTLTPPFSSNNNSDNKFIDTVSIKINGVEIGTPYENVLRQLGKPLSSKRKGNNPCGGAKTVLYYSGLIITLDEDDDKKSIVVLVEVTSPKWEVASEISIGSSLEDVQTKFGQSGKLAKESGSNVLTFLDGDGAVEFYFRNNKLVKVVRDLNLC